MGLESYLCPRPIAYPTHLLLYMFMYRPMQPYLGSSIRAYRKKYIVKSPLWFVSPSYLSCRPDTSPQGPMQKCAGKRFGMSASGCRSHGSFLYRHDRTSLLSGSCKLCGQASPSCRQLQLRNTLGRGPHFCAVLEEAPAEFLVAVWVYRWPHLHGVGGSTLAPQQVPGSSRWLVPCTAGL